MEGEATVSPYDYYPYDYYPHDYSTPITYMKYKSYMHNINYKIVKSNQCNISKSHRGKVVGGNSRRGNSRKGNSRRGFRQPTVTNTPQIIGRVCLKHLNGVCTSIWRILKVDLSMNPGFSRHKRVSPKRNDEISTLQDANISFIRIQQFFEGYQRYPEIIVHFYS